MNEIFTYFVLLFNDSYKKFSSNNIFNQQTIYFHSLKYENIQNEVIKINTMITRRTMDTVINADR